MDLVQSPGTDLSLRSKHDPKFAQNTRTGDDASMQPPPPPSATISSLAYSAAKVSNDDLQEESSTRAARDNTVAAHAHQFKKVLELSDVIIQVCSNNSLPIGDALFLINSSCLTIGTRCTRSYGMPKSSCGRRGQTCWRRQNDDPRPQQNR